MASTSETGHAKNVANFKTLITYAESLGERYNPTKAGLKLKALCEQYDKADKSIKELSDALTPYRDAVTAQELGFKPLDKLVTRIVNAYKASVEDPAQAESIVSIKKKMTATVSKKQADEEGKDKKPARSISQRSYDNRLSNFSDLISILAATKDYQPSEEELQVASLETLYDDLFKKTNEIDRFEGAVVNNRIIRNKVLYAPKTGVLDTVEGVKNYVLSVYGSGSPQVKYVNQLKFRA